MEVDIGVAIGSDTNVDVGDGEGASVCGTRMDVGSEVAFAVGGDEGATTGSEMGVTSEEQAVSKTAIAHSSPHENGKRPRGRLVRRKPGSVIECLSVYQSWNHTLL